MAEHGLETGEEGALPAARRSIEPDGELVAHVSGEGVAGELLQEGGRHWYGVANEIVPSQRLYPGPVLVRHQACGVMSGPMLLELTCRDAERAVLADEDIRVRVPSLIGDEHVDARE